MSRKPLIIAMDVNPLVNAKKSGVGYYTDRLLEALATRHPDKIHIIGHYFNFLDKKSVNLPSYPNVSYRRTRYFPSKILNILRRVGIELPFEFFLPGKSDFVIFPNFVGYPLLRKTPVTAVVHDLSYLDSPEYVSGPNRKHLRRYVPRSIKRSSFITTVSETTKQSIQKHYRLSANKIFVTPIPPPISSARPHQPKSVQGKYILFVGTLEPRKNFISLVRAYMLLPDSIRNEYTLVLAGGNGWDIKDELLEIKGLQESGERIVLTGYFSDQEKSWLFKNASVFIQPSHDEGFGMPILEAMEGGTPTAVSNIPIFHEVSGSASIYFDQNDPESIQAAILNILSNPALQTELRLQGKLRLENLDWGTIADQFYERVFSQVQKL